MGDPAKVAQAVLKIADAEILPPHILLGSHAVQIAHHAEQARAAEAERWKALSAWIDMDAAGQFRRCHALTPPFFALY